MLMRIGLAVSSLALAFGPSAVRADQGPGKYQYVSVPALPGGTFTNPSAINDCGQVVGGGDVADGSTHAFLYDVGRGKTTDLGEGFAYAINTFGLVVGQSNEGQAVRYHNGKAIPLGSLTGEIGSIATSVNDLGIAVGYSVASPRFFTLVVYAFGTAFPINLGTGLELFPAVSPMINDDGIVSGTVFPSTPGGGFRAFRHDIWTGQTTFFDPLPGDTDTWALGVNARGEILGYSFVNGSTEHIGTWDRHGKFTVHFTEGTTQFPTVSGNLAFNNNDQIVISETNDLASYLVPTIGQRFDLDTLVVNLPAGQQVLFNLVGINDDGLITGYNFDSPGGFVLIPVHGKH